jgi:hypothetical protein
MAVRLLKAPLGAGKLTLRIDGDAGILLNARATGGAQLCLRCFARSSPVHRSGHTALLRPGTALPVCGTLRLGIGARLAGHDVRARYHRR